MELKQFSDELLNKMKGQMESISLDQPDIILRTSQIISLIEACMIELKQYVVKYKFKNSNEEVEFFKNTKPIFISQLWYHKSIFKIHLFESFNDDDARINYYNQKLNSLQRFAIRQTEFYRYVLSNSVNMDEQYFLRINVQRKSLNQDERFSTRYDKTLSRILTNELLRNYLLSSIRKSKGSLDLNSQPLSWTGSKTDLIELIYALQSTGVFNQASTDVKQIANYFESVFNVSLGNYYRTFQEIRLRKSGQTNFIDEMRKSLLTRIMSNES